MAAVLRRLPQKGHHEFSHFFENSCSIEGEVRVGPIVEKGESFELKLSMYLVVPLDREVQLTWRRNEVIRTRMDLCPIRLRTLLK